MGGSRIQLFKETETVLPRSLAKFCQDGDV